MSAVPRPGDGLLHPLALAAIALLVVNDHVLKRAFPGVVTGKLSDVAGMVVLPLFLVAAAELGQAAAHRFRGPSRRLLLISLALSVAVLALIKTLPAAAEAYRVGLGALQWPFVALASLCRDGPVPGLHQVALARDPTDLVALPAAWLAWVAGRSRLR